MSEQRRKNQKNFLNGRHKLLLTVSPRNLNSFREEFINYSIKNYGDVGVALKSGAPPKYVEDDFKVVMPDVMPKAGSIEHDILKDEVKYFNDKRRTYSEEAPKLFADLLSHLSNDSKRLLKTKYGQEVEEAQDANDFIRLWVLIQNAHLLNGVEASSHDRLRARQRLNSFVQRKGQTYEQYVYAFETQLETCNELEVNLEIKETITAFLSGLDRSVYGRKARELLECIDDDDQYSHNQ